jgi:glutathione S-transferase
MYRLINAGPSPYGRKVAVALHEKGLAFETVYDLPWADAVKTREHSPLEQLPILLTEDGEAIYDSSFILDWLEWVHPEPALLPATLAEKIAARRLQVLGERLMEISQTLIFEHNRPVPAQANIDRQARKLRSGLPAAEALVAASRSDVTRPNLGEIALATTLLVWDFVISEGMIPALPAFTWRPKCPAMVALIERLERRQSFVLTQPKPMTVDFSGITT